jgi:hypothetical protein
VSGYVEGGGGRLQRIAARLDEGQYPDPAVALRAVLSGKLPESLTDEGFGRARDVIEVAVTLREQQRQQRAAGQYVVLLPSGQRRHLSPPTEQPGAEVPIAADVCRWRDQTVLTSDQLAFLALQTLFGADASDSGEASERGNPAAGGEA